MGPAQRRKEVLDRLNRSGSAPLAELAGALGVSEMTMRRDVAALEASSLAKLDKGVVIKTADSLAELTMAAKRGEHVEAKRRIAAAAAATIQDGETLFIDAGTTALELALMLRGRRGLTVLTHSLLVANALSREASIRTIMCPGEMRVVSQAYLGPLTCDFINSFHVSRAFLGAEGITRARGLTVPDPADGAVKRHVIEAADTSVLLADGSKVGTERLYTYASARAIDLLVTDEAAPADEVASLRELGLDVTLA